MYILDSILKVQKIKTEKKTTLINSPIYWGHLDNSNVTTNTKHTDKRSGISFK